MAGLIGAAGLILGVAYPLLAVITARRQPPAAAPGDRRPADAARERTGEPGPRDRGTPLTAMV